MAVSKPYHHANLKETLLNAAVALVAELGPRAFTLREVARRAGVSHNAPYRHFKDREDLLTAVAAQGFERLNESMRTAMESGGTAAEKLRFAGRGYVEFALRWPQHIQVMFDLPPSSPPSPDYALLGKAAFGTLLGAIVAAQSEGGLPAGDPNPLAAVAWSGVHGLAKLCISGHLSLNPRQALDFTGYLTAAMTAGMAALPHPSV